MSLVDDSTKHGLTIYYDDTSNPSGGRVDIFSSKCISLSADNATNDGSIDLSADIINLNATDINFKGSIIPEVHNTYDLGTNNKRWRDINSRYLFLAGQSSKGLNIHQPFFSDGDERISLRSTYWHTDLWIDKDIDIAPEGKCVISKGGLNINEGGLDINAGRMVLNSNIYGTIADMEALAATAVEG
jgi:hypothetical protein